jgi:hypothetical protein
VIPCSPDFIAALKNPIKQAYIKMEIFDSNMVFIEEITKQVTKDDIGKISISVDRPIRRSFSFALNNTDGAFTWGDSGRLIWIDKRVKLYTGLKLPNGNIEYIPQGVFILSDPSDTHNLDKGKKTFLTGQDKAYLLSDNRGKIVNDLTIATGTNIASAIKTIANNAGETLYNFDSVSVVTPYELHYSAGESTWKIIKELADLAICDIYYDVYGYLRLKLYNLNEIDQYPAVWTFKYNDPTEKFYAGNVRRLDVGEMCNFVRTCGGSGQSATVTYDLIVDETNPLWVGSPYSIQKLGKIVYFHNNGTPDPLISDIALAKARCKWELMHRLGYSEKVSLNISPLQILDGNDVIGIEDSENNVTGKYRIVSFDVPIIPDLMTIECLKHRQILTDWNAI